jgi:hypothetical protein
LRTFAVNYIAGGGVVSACSGSVASSAAVRIKNKLIFQPGGRMFINSGPLVLFNLPELVQLCDRSLRTEAISYQNQPISTLDNSTINVSKKSEKVHNAKALIILENKKFSEFLRYRLERNHDRKRCFLFLWNFGRVLQ